jgi:hypothetical protein
MAARPSNCLRQNSCRTLSIVSSLEQYRRGASVSHSEPLVNSLFVSARVSGINLERDPSTLTAPPVSTGGQGLGDAAIRGRLPTTDLATQRFREPVPAEGPIARLVRRASGVFNARVPREVDAGSCEQISMRESFAGIAVAGKNRCIRTRAQRA